MNEEIHHPFPSDPFVLHRRSTSPREKGQTQQNCTSETKLTRMWNNRRTTTHTKRFYPKRKMAPRMGGEMRNDVFVYPFTFAEFYSAPCTSDELQFPPSVESSGGIFMDFEAETMSNHRQGPNRKCLHGRFEHLYSPSAV